MFDVIPWNPYLKAEVLTANKPWKYSSVEPSYCELPAKVEPATVAIIPDTEKIENAANYQEWRNSTAEMLGAVPSAPGDVTVK